MKAQILQEDLGKALSICSRFASTRVQLPVLANILFETSKNKLRVSSTNLEVSVSVSIGANISEEGSITVPSKIITELVGNIKKGQMSLHSEKENLEVKTPDFESVVAGMNSSDFPVTPRDIGASSLKFKAEEFTQALSRVLFSVSTDETRPTLTGILIIVKEKEVVFVATDGFRLSQKKIKTESNSEEKKVIVPKNVLSELVRISNGNDIELSIKKADNQIIFALDNVIMASRIIEGEFPDFEKIIPKESGFKLTVDKEELLRSIKLASVFARDSANVIKLNIDKNNLEITAESQQFGSQKGKIDIKTDGKLNDKFVIAFNYRFLEDFLNSIDSDEVQMEFSDSNAPVLFLDPKDTDFLHIIMPVRIQS